MVVVFEDGRIIEKGNYLDLLYKSTSELRKIIEEAKGSNFSIQDCIKENVISNFKTSRRTSQFYTASTFGLDNRSKTNPFNTNKPIKKSRFRQTKSLRKNSELEEIQEIALFGESENSVTSSPKNLESSKREIKVIPPTPEEKPKIRIKKSARGSHKKVLSEGEEEKEGGLLDSKTPAIQSRKTTLTPKRVSIMARMTYRSIMSTTGKIVDEESLNFQEAMANLKKFLMLRGKFPILMVMLIFIMSTLFTVSYDLWIGFWNNQTFGDLGDSNYFYAYIALGVTGNIYLTVRDIIYDCILHASSDRINEMVIGKIFRLPMSWFDRQPLKRVMYRMTKDQSELDIMIPNIVLGLIESTFMLIAGVIIVSWLFIALVPIAAIILIFVISGMLGRYLRVTLKISHYISISKSEVVAACSEIMNVAVYLRNCRTLDIIIDEFYEINDSFQRNMTNVGNFSQRWIGIRLIFISSVLVFISFCYPVMFSTVVGFLAVDSFEIGLGITWSLRTIKYLKKFVLKNSLVFTKMISISRLYEYLGMELFLEEDGGDEQLRPTACVQGANESRGKNQIVPSRMTRPLGEEFGHQDPRRRDSNNMLKREEEEEKNSLMIHRVSLETMGSRQTLFNISLELKSHEVIGLYGRTMSGITQLLEVVFGLYDRQRDGYHLDSFIKIADKSIDMCHVKEWRSHFMYLEEEPMIASGTVRDNIDPYQKYTDDFIIKTLHFLKFNELIYSVNSLSKQKSGADNSFKPIRAPLKKISGLSGIDLSKFEEEEDHRQMTPIQSKLNVSSKRNSFPIIKKLLIF